MGVHLTLTSEWDSYRWGPLSTRNRNSGRMDADGYFYRSAEEVWANGDPDAVNTELHTQFEQAINAGIIITHLDTHMNSIAHPKFIASYIQLAIQEKLPFLFPRLNEAGFIGLGFDGEIATIATHSVGVLEEQGIPLVDNVTGLYLDKPLNRFEQAKQVLNDLPVGVSHFIIHPSIDSADLRAITPDWQSRVADYQTFMDENLRKFINNIGLHVIGYKTLYNLLS